MANAIILHGMPEQQDYYNSSLPSESNAHWLPWLQKQLIVKSIEAVTPEIPRAYAPDWNTWVREVERFTLGPSTTLVGHSCGGGFWVRYLSEHPNLWVNKVILVAPWLDPDKDETNGFFNFTIDPSLMSRVKKLVIFNSDNDSGNVLKSVAQLRETFPQAEYREFHKYGHFRFGDMGTVEFPELADIILKD